MRDLRAETGRLAEIRVRSGVLTGAATLILEMGGDPAAICRAAGVPDIALLEDDYPLGALQVIDFLEQAVRQTRQENFGLKLSLRQTLSVLGPVWLLLENAGNVREMLQDLGKYFALHTKGAQVSITLASEGLWVGYGLSAGLAGNDVQVMELGIGLLCNELRSLAPSGWEPAQVEFRHSPPRDLSLHRRLFGPNLVFEAARNALLVEPALLKHPLGRASGTHRQRIRELLEESGPGGADPALMAERTIKAMLPYCDCSIAAVASTIGLSERTLQRRLAEAGTSYSEVLDRVRADLALRYLRQSRLSQAEIADILGYSDPTAFCRAFRRWHGTTAGRIEKRW